jgi:hypoxanthine-guanine phosphoribosyltransferase
MVRAGGEKECTEESRKTEHMPSKVMAFVLVLCGAFAFLAPMMEQIDLLQNLNF